MSAEKRSVSTDALQTLGTIIEDGGRDAIHLAVEPVIAGESINAGENLVIIEGKAYPAIHYPDNKKLGIADPFLTQRVQKGEKFWLIVYPRQITSLRHVWSHPDFPEETNVPVSDKEASIKWMTEWAKKHMSSDYYGDEVTVSDERALANAIEAGADHHLGPYESADEYIDNEWWGHWETITGKKGDRNGYFSCSC